MAERKRIGLREVRALAPGGIVYDAAVPGFAARRQQDAVTFVLRYRTAGDRQRWHTIGRLGAPWTPDQARDEARRVLGDVAKGLDPAGGKRAARKALTVADLCNEYWAEIEAGRLLTRTGRPKKASTLVSDKSRMDRHIKPLLGSLSVAGVTRQDVTTFMHAVAEGKTKRREPTGNKRGLSNVRGGRGAATRTMSLLGVVFSYAVERGLRVDNPVHHVRTFAENKRERRLSDQEYAALGEACRTLAADGMWSPALAAIRFLTLTGWRSGEALGSRWSDVDLPRRTATLAETKSGKSVRPLSNAACDLLRALPRINDRDLVFPASRGASTMSGFRSYWDRAAKLAALPDEITPHTLRHSFASLAGDLGYSESTIGALVGHKGHSITSRYVHSADAVLLAAADAVARKTAELMGDAPADAKVIPMQRAQQRA